MLKLVSNKLKRIDYFMFSTNLKTLRHSKGLTQADLAKILNTSVSSIGMYEQGRRMPDNKMLKKISSVFYISIDNMLGVLSPHKEIKDVIDDITNMLKGHKGLMFNGKPISHIDKIKLVNAIKVAAAVTISESEGNKLYENTKEVIQSFN